MNQVIEILTSLGINHTLFLQFGVFFLAYVAMSQIVFKPYLSQYNERLRRTVGGQKEAHSLTMEAEEKELQYREVARKLNSEIRSIFQENNAKAKVETDQLLKQAQKKAELELESARKDLQKAVEEARNELDSHIPDISHNIQKKFVRH